MGDRDSGDAITLTLEQVTELHSLRFHWTPPYRITTDGLIWRASLVANPTVELTARSAGELQAAIRADYAGRPELYEQARAHDPDRCWCGDAHTDDGEPMPDSAS